MTYNEQTPGPFPNSISPSLTNGQINHSSRTSSPPKVVVETAVATGEVAVRTRARATRPRALLRRARRTTRTRKDEPYRLYNSEGDYNREKGTCCFKHICSKCFKHGCPGVHKCKNS